MSEQRQDKLDQRQRSDEQAEAWHIYTELRSLALHSNFSIMLGHRGIHVDVRAGPIRTLEAYFERQADVSFYRRYYGFSEKRIRAGLIHLLSYWRTEHEGIPVKRSITVSLWPGRMLAKNREVPHQGEPIQLEPIELYVLNAFSFLSLAPLYIQEQFGGCLEFTRLLGSGIDMQGIEMVLLKDSREVSPLFAGGLTLFHLDYCLNRENARDDLDAFRSYLQKASMASLESSRLLEKPMSALHNPSTV